MRNIDDYEKKYMENIDFENVMVKYRRKKLLEIMQELKPQKIVEIGCGLEPTISFVEYDWKKYVVFEPGKTFYEKAKKTLQNNSGVELYNDPFDGEKCRNVIDADFIICSEVLHEVEKPLELLKEIQKACSPKTMVYINVPNANSFHRKLALEMNLISDVTQLSDRNQYLQQHSVFSKESLVDLCKEAGFDEVKWGGIMVKPFTHGQMAQLVENDIMSEEMLEGLYKMGEDLPEISAEMYLLVKSII